MVGLTLYDLALAGLGAAIVWMDLRRGIIPDWANLGLVVVGLADAALTGRDALFARAIDAALVGGLFLAVRTVYWRWRGRIGLGLGDVKFLAAATTIVELQGIMIAVLVACLSGLTMIAVATLAGRPISATSAIRFGPHLVLGLFVAVYGLPADAGWPLPP